MSDGSLLSPFALPAGLGASAWVKPGGTLYVLDGTMTSDATLTLVGSPGNPATIRAYGTGAKLNGGVTVSGDDLLIRDLEIYYGGWTSRESAQTGSNPADIPLEKALGGTGKRVKFINCILHDLPLIYFSEDAEEIEFYGCVIYHIGWTAPDRQHGHGLYLHSTVQTCKVVDCIIFDNFGWGIHAYAPLGSQLKYFEFVGSTVFGNGSLGGTLNPGILLGADSGQADTATIRENMTYGNKAGYGLQFYGAGATNITLTDNYIPEGKTGTYTAVVESGNTYLTIGNTSFLRANEYNANRANLTIYNQDEVDTVEMDVSALGWTGQVIVRNVQDYINDTQTLEVVDGAIIVNMQAGNRTVATPVGWTAPATTFPKFGAFVLETT